MAFSNEITGGQGTLVRPAIKSPDYSPGISGWSINKDGSAEFNNLTFRGTFRGNGVIINAAGFFLYSGTPAAGNMIGSWAPADGTDEFGNPYVAGLSLYDADQNLNNFLGGPDNAIWNQAGFPDGEWVAMTVGNFVMGVGSPTDGINLGTAGLLGVLGVGFGSVWQSPSDPPGGTYTENAFVRLMAGTPGGGQGTVNEPVMQMDGGISVQDAVVKYTSTFDIPSWRNVPEVWHTPVYGTNWLGSTTFNTSTNWGTLQYRKDAQDNLHICGAFKANTTAPGATVFNLPAGYRPLKQWGVFCQRNNAGTLSSGNLAVSPSGNVILLTATGLAVTASNEFLVPGGIIPLGNIA